MCKKISASILTLMFVMLLVPGGINAAVNLPPMVDMLYEDSFDGETLDSRIDLTTAAPAGSRSVQENGTLHLVRPASKGTAGARIYFNKDRTATPDRLVVEYSMTRTSADRSSIIQWLNYSTASATRRSIDIRWEWGGSVTIEGGEAKATFNAEDYSSALSLKVTILFDITDGTYSVWLNDKAAVTSSPVRAATSELSLSHLYVYNDAVTVLDLSILDFKAYTVHSTGMPAVWNEKYKDDFSEGQTANVVFETAGGTAAIADNAIKVNALSSGTTGARIYLNEEKTAVSGRFVLEFTLVRSAANNSVTIWLNGTSNRGIDMRWTSLGTILVYDAENVGQSPAYTSLTASDYKAANEMKLTFLMDIDASGETAIGTYSLSFTTLARIRT